jgi:hypothetical protein
MQQSLVDMDTLSIDHDKKPEMDVRQYSLINNQNMQADFKEPKKLSLTEL